MQLILQTLEEYGPLSDALKDALTNAFVRKEIPKGTCILEEGRVCQHLGIIERGLVRYFGYKEGKDVTFEFACEFDCCIGLMSYVKQEPSFEYIETLEDSVIYFIHRDKLEHLFDEYPRLNFNFRKILELYCVNAEEQAYLLQCHTTKERYLYLLEQWPDLFARVSLGHIASYLGMTQANLSRIRKSIMVQ